MSDEDRTPNPFHRMSMRWTDWFVYFHVMDALPGKGEFRNSGEPHRDSDRVTGSWTPNNHVRTKWKKLLEKHLTLIYWKATLNSPKTRVEPRRWRRRVWKLETRHFPMQIFSSNSLSNTRGHLKIYAMLVRR